ncbi:Toxin-antitoxin system, toxin component domain protein [uncultured Eubacteriales bacterium]|uniref:Toxin-antitoxin system, toxin component domain protein n=1 Tax=uncultured Eubacteriales bacterium TaxID=172733 RepID=A0A212JJ25_9FIRM|nr:Toxin-antitoxin system, toxin component domain protein [uncultured Eubacteriales bacterium]
MIIKITPNENGSHANQSTTPQIIPDGWIEVPAHLEADFIASGALCDLTIEGGALVGITPLPIPDPEPEDPSMTVQEATLDMLADIDYRLGILELAGEEVTV